MFAFECIHFWNVSSDGKSISVSISHIDFIWFFFLSSPPAVTVYCFFSLYLFTVFPFQFRYALCNYRENVSHSNRNDNALVSWIAAEFHWKSTIFKFNLRHSNTMAFFSILPIRNGHRVRCVYDQHYVRLIRITKDFPLKSMVWAQLNPP